MSEHTDNASPETTIPKIVLTGGPCAGKTTALSRIFTRLASMGCRPIMVPEAATLTILAGVDPGVVSGHDFQLGLALTQMALEDRFEDYARKMPGPERPVLVCDRGVMDGKAYCDEGSWKNLLLALNKSEVELRECRYSAAIHLVTAAHGAEEYYNLDNAARKETPEQARALDDRLQEAWLLHPHSRVIDNSGSFAHKMHRVEEAVLDALGLPVPIEAEKKYTLPLSAEKALVESGVPFASVEIEQTYLLAPVGEERRVRRRSQDDASAYFYCVKRPLSHGRRIEEERIITKNEYNLLLAQQDPEFAPVRKTRYCYRHANQYQELDIYLFPKPGFAVVEVETKGDVVLPPFFRDAVEVTGNEAFSNKEIARRLVLPAKANPPSLGVSPVLRMLQQVAHE